jgi:outer membrane lipase/esterase
MDGPLGATSARLIVNSWMAPNATSQHVYGRVAAGVVAPVSNSVALTANIWQTFARQGDNDFYGNGGLKI